MEKQRDRKWKQFEQNAIKERRAWKSYADIGYGKRAKVVSISNESKLEQRATKEKKEKSVDVCKRNDDRPNLLRSLPTKILRITENLKSKRRKTYKEAMRSVGTSNSGEEVLEPLKTTNDLKEKNHDFNRTVGIDFESVYAKLKEDELLGSDTLYSPPRLYIDTSSPYNSSRYKNVIFGS